jgi:hypothetical protein
MAPCPRHRLKASLHVVRRAEPDCRSSHDTSDRRGLNLSSWFVRLRSFAPLITMQPL